MGIWFANIGFNMKLFLGFGVVLTLTAILAAIGWACLSPRNIAWTNTKPPAKRARRRTLG